MVENVGFKRKRKYFPETFDPSSASQVRSALEEILSADVKSTQDIVKLIEKFTELHDIVEEEAGWRYIRMTCDVARKEYADAYNWYYENVVTIFKRHEFEIKKKIHDLSLKYGLPDEYRHFFRMISKDIELFREENIPLQVEETKLSNRYRELLGNITVRFRGQEKTLQQLLAYLKDPDRALREEAWRKRYEAIMQKREELNTLFDRLKEVRIKQARNAGFDNYRDYMHELKRRFEYSPEDLYNFHESVEKEVVPFLKERTEVRRRKLGLDTVRPWDMKVDTEGRVLKPFENADEFVEKAVNVLYRVNPVFGERFKLMKEAGLLDLENRKGKAPGGYNYPLMETGAPFIFMNAVGRSEDVRTLLHESGHAMHTFETVGIPVYLYRPERMEVAELASMGMELITLEQWKEFYPDERDYRKAVEEELENALYFLPWCMIVDAFQHWIYTNPDHSPLEREEYFAYLMDRFNPGVDWSGLEEKKRVRWLFQLHIFEVPFYYIEYGIAQLGALAIYRNYLEDREKALERYVRFLKVGCSVPVNEAYETAGIKLDFSREYIKKIVEFAAERLQQL